jgi:REP element-mobilizing transposase RayT
MRYYERRLPHWDTVDQPLFVTFRLQGSLPANRIFLPDGLAQSGKAFVAMDRLLDRSDRGPLHLRRSEIASLVVDALKAGDQRFHRYHLHAFVVMPNHIHLLVTPSVVASRWLAPLKGFTAFCANQVLGSRGQAFWQDESYDRLVRSGAEFDRIQTYIEENPVTAGLVLEASLYPWSSATSRLKGGCGHNWPPHILSRPGFSCSREYHDITGTPL